MTEPYPWQSAIWCELGRLELQDRLPHALLIVGGAGLGKRDLADLLARRLLCESHDPDQKPCGVCRGCRLCSAGHHPDFYRVAPEGKRNAILVDQIRDLIDFVALTSQQSGRKIAYLRDAERMNPNAANSFLKTLEEPPDKTLVLMTSDAPTRLPATVRSRCQLVRISKPNHAIALRWLADQGFGDSGELLLGLAGNAPLKARALAEETVLARRRALFSQFLGLLRGAEDPLALAARWHEGDSAETLTHLHGWTQDLVRLSTTESQVAIRNKDFAVELAALAKRLPIAALFAMLGRTEQMLTWSETSVSPQLTFEDLLIDWTRIAPSGNRHEDF